MNKKQIVFIIGAILFIILIGVYFIKLKPDNQKQRTGLTVEGINLYYTNACPHCKNVQDYINANGIRQKVSFQEKEISSNQSYSSEMSSLAATCGIATSQVGVPFLWDGKKCFIGDKDVISFFQKRANSE